jgi:hypothetical protein
MGKDRHGLTEESESLLGLFHLADIGRQLQNSDHITQGIRNGGRVNHHVDGFPAAQMHDLFAYVGLLVLKGFPDRTGRATDGTPQIDFMALLADRLAELVPKGLVGLQDGERSVLNGDIARKQIDNRLIPKVKEGGMRFFFHHPDVSGRFEPAEPVWGYFRLLRMASRSSSGSGGFSI